MKNIAMVDIYQWKEAPQSDVMLSKAESGRREGSAFKTVDELRAYLVRAPADVTQEAVDAFESGKYGKAVPFILSDETEDRDGDIISAGAWNLTEYRKNPVVMFGHDHSHPVIGNGYGLHVADGKLKGIAFFVSKETAPELAFYGDMADVGIYRAVSVGFIPKSYVQEPARGAYALRMTDVELIEFSLVNVGSNRNAISDAKKFGVDVEPWTKWAQSQINKSVETPVAAVVEMVTPAVEEVACEVLPDESKPEQEAKVDDKTECVPDTETEKINTPEPVAAPEDTCVDKKDADIVKQEEYELTEQLIAETIAEIIGELIE